MAEKPQPESVTLKVLFPIGDKLLVIPTLPEVFRVIHSLSAVGPKLPIKET
jgi:hypothetical protein